MYKLEYLPIALQDIVEIVNYISHTLKNQESASNLAESFIAKAESLLIFPYKNPVCQLIRPLKHEYRKILVENYLIFYWVDEEKKLVTVARVIYAKRDYSNLLEKNISERIS